MSIGTPGWGDLACGPSLFPTVGACMAIASDGAKDGDLSCGDRINNEGVERRTPPIDRRDCKKESRLKEHISAIRPGDINPLVYGGSKAFACMSHNKGVVRDQNNCNHFEISGQPHLGDSYMQHSLN